MKRKIVILFLIIFLVSCGEYITKQKEPKNIDGVIYYIPHQDDEILSMGAALRRDIVKGKEVYILLLSDGSTSSIFEPINERLEEEGYPTLTREEFSKARTREMKKSLEELGFNLDNFYETNIIDDGSVTPEVVYEEGNKLIQKLNGGKYHHKTLGDFEFEENGTHLASFKGVKKIAEESGDPASFFYGVLVEKLEPLPKNKIKPETKEDLERIEKALNSYNRWDPKNGFYAIGYQSVRYAFDRELEDPTSYIIEEINIK